MDCLGHAASVLARGEVLERVAEALLLDGDRGELRAEGGDFAIHALKNAVKVAHFLGHGALDHLLHRRQELALRHVPRHSMRCSVRTERGT